ncbi:MAG TPA: oligopeptide:H+ symporter [Caulobacteraceae bacterium]|jgi:POT family proton-dependent oligopeptide transporter|nr:oligopeptide:H+ symporter [Caulobacteraceae bacterium]
MNIVILIGVLITIMTGIPVGLQLARQHPRGLFVLFFAEMWERFSYYGMRGLLVFYLTQHFLFDQKAASAQYGSYATLVYLMPLVGGVLADRYLGSRKAVAFGAILLVVGQCLMAVQGPPAQQSLVVHGVSYPLAVHGRGDDRQVRVQVAGGEYAFDKAPDGAFEVKGLPAAAPLPAKIAPGAYSLVTSPVPPLYQGALYLALALIIVGVGFLKPNISSVVGQLYGRGDPRRDPGFTLYYFGVNMGAFWAAVLCGYLGQTYGWSWGFGLAGAGMAAGWISFQLGRSWLDGRGEPPDPVRLRAPVFGPLNREWLIYLLAIVGLVPTFLLVQHNAIVGVILAISSIAVLGYVGVHMGRAGKVERERLGLALALIAGSIVFFTLFEQAATSLNLFAEQNTQLALVGSPHVWSVGGLTFFFGDRAMWMAAHPSPGVVWIDMSFTAAQVQSFNAGFILLLAPIFAAVWSALGRRGRDPNAMVKFGLGLAQVGLGFLAIVACGGMADAHFRVPLLVLALAYFLHTTGELCLSPVGMSQVTKLSPAILVSTMMAIWFLATSWAQFIGALIAKLAATETAGGQVLDPAAALHASLRVFAAIGWAGVGFGVLFLVLSPWLKRWAHGADDLRADDAHEPIAPDVDAGLQELNPATVRGEGPA